MERFTRLVRAQASMVELRGLLGRVVARADLHARLVNTLSRMEYIGVRKMLKARHADRLDEEGLLHLIEEASHALRLKRAAIQLNGGEAAGVATYAEEDSLAGPAGEAYMQGVDRACEELLAPFEMEQKDRSEANYLLSTAAIEVRAEAFYPIYEECLLAAGAPFSVKAILKDELRHLAEMEASLAAALPNEWESLMGHAVEAERVCFEGWLVAVAAGVESAETVRA
jgi:hypothetical protein